MADSRSIIIDTTTQNGIKKQKSFTDVDPEATAVEMLNFANAAVALTTDTFRAASYVDKEYLSGGSIMKEQLKTSNGSYSTTKSYPTTSAETAVDLIVQHADGTALTTDELCAANITVKPYVTDAFYKVHVNNSTGRLIITLYPTTSLTPTLPNHYGINQSTTPAQPFSTTLGAGRIEVTIHDSATYKGFTYTVNVNAKGA